MRLTEDGLQAAGFLTTMRALPDSTINNTHVVDENHVFAETDTYEDWIQTMWGVSVLDKTVDFIGLIGQDFYAPKFSNTMRHYDESAIIEESHVVDENHVFQEEDTYEDFVFVMTGLVADDTGVDKTRILHKTVFSQNFEEVV